VANGALDARIGSEALFEVVQALPEAEHEIRRQLLGGVPPFVYTEHAQDHVQFRQVIIDAIELKHSKDYTDSRTLIVAFDGDYSFEMDENVHRWVAAVREKTRRGAFKEILLVEVARRKVFPVFRAMQGVLPGKPRGVPGDRAAKVGTDGASARGG